MIKQRVNVCIFKRSSQDHWHQGIMVNAETENCLIVDQFGNAYESVYDFRNILDEGCFQYEINSDEISNNIKERRQFIK